MIRKAIVFYLIATIMLPPLTAGAVTIPGFYGKVKSPLRAVGATQLPVLKSPNEKVKDGEYVIDDTTTANKMTINQQKDKIVVDWNSFDIGSAASVHFDQKGNASWAALNRIWDASPSQIFGRLTADGKIYLLNQNGILFAPGSQVNTHTLIASSLNLSKTDFLNNTLKFNRSQEQGETFYDLNNIPGTETNPGVVTNLGTIATKDQGSVFLIGPNVENGGTIEANLGQIGLIAGHDLELVSSVSDTSTLNYPGSGKGASETRNALLVKMTQRPDGSTAWNMEGGSLGADQGHVGMYGGIVNQDGLIRSVTAVQRAGHVELMASQRITTGANSWIATPVSSSTDKFSNIDTYESTIILSGLDSARPWDPLTYPDTIEHHGRIDAPQGYVELRATDRVYLDSGSTIDVSGLWVNKSASDQVVTASMTSLNLRDAFMQKNGILKGQTITMGALTGSTVGDVSGSFSEGLTAVERHTQGGHVVIGLVRDRLQNNSTATGDFILRNGATVNFAGGGFRYAAGTANTTVLVSGNKIYDIGTADPNIRYDRIMNTQKIIHKRQGITDTYEGIYYGGVIPLNMGLPAHTQGSNAGSFTIGARQAVLDGAISGNVEKGIYQYLAANPTTNNSQLKSGYVEPMAGELYLGNTLALSFITDNDTLDRYLGDIIISGNAGPVLASGFTSTSDLGQVLGTGKTVLSSVILNNAGLSTIYLAANKTVTIEKNAAIALVSGKQDQADSNTKTSTFEVKARRIEHFGSVTVPGGDIKLAIEGNKTTNPTDEEYVSINERIYLADGSALDVKGERIDNRIVANAGAVRLGAHTTGGSVTVLDGTINNNIGKQEGIAVSKGALIDVSGGWLINTSGKVSRRDYIDNRDAGSITFQGHSLFIDGDLQGYSLRGDKGGTISMHAGDISVGAVTTTLPVGFDADSPWPDEMRGAFVLGAGRFNDTGFTNITLKSLTGLTVGEGVQFSPSIAKLTVTGTIIKAIRDDVGASSITMRANTPFDYRPIGTRYSDINMPESAAGSPLMQDHPDTVLIVSPGAILETAPGGSITLNGPAVDIYGTINAPAGTITIASAVEDLRLHSGARVLAEGYNKRSAALLKGLPLEYTPVSAGSITLKSNAALNIETGAEVSVDGSSPVRRSWMEENFTISSYTDAGGAGSITLSAFDNITLDGILKGQAGMAGRQGGGLTVKKTNNSGTLSVSAEGLIRYRNEGFDALTLASEGTLEFHGSMEMVFGRSLTLNARKLTGIESSVISLSAPWVQVMYNPINIPTDQIDSAPGGAVLRLAGQFLDVTGDVVFSGFSNTYLHADRDMRLAGQGSSNNGSLRTAGDLTLEAARIFPTTGSVFAITTTPGSGTPGKITVLSSGNSATGPIYSAGGHLSVSASGGIEHRGYIAAPLGAISLEATGTGLNGRVYLSEDSVTTTRGDLAVKYGTIDADSNYDWKNDTGSSITSASEKSVSLNGEDIIIREGSTIDISGGEGGIFSYLFEPSVSGTNNPLRKTSNGKNMRWVILPDNSIVLPGSAVYLAGGNGLSAGVYSLLPEEYAFLPGAMILTDLNISLSGAKQRRTKEGYAVVAGYGTVMGTGIQSGPLKAYSLRSAADVLNEGTFITKSFIAGDGGALKITAANTAIIDGDIKASAQTGFKAGGLYVGGNHVVLQSSVPPLPTGFGFSSPISIALAGTANVNQSLLSGNTFGTISLGYDPAAIGDHIVSTAVTLKEGTILEAETIFLGARERITLEKGSQVFAIASGGRRGEVTFSSPLGEVVTGEHSVVHVSDAINLDTTNLNLHPDAVFMSDHSELNLIGPKITFVQGSYNRSGNDTGLFLTDRQFANLGSSFENIGLKSTSDITFNGDFVLSVTDTLTIDTGLVQGIGGGSVELAASMINILNTGATPSIGQGSAGSGAITFTAANTTGSTESSIYIGKGTVLFDGFAAGNPEYSGVNLKAQNDLIFRGTGTLNTGNADLSITAVRVATNSYMDNGTYTAPNFTINAGTGAVNIAKTPGGSAGGNPASPGRLEIKADAIDVSTLIETPAGQLKLTAASNITLNNGAKLRAIGNSYAPGGDIILMSTGGGAIDINETYDELGNIIASIDVSGGTQGDAGSISLYAPTGGVSLSGDIHGQAGTKPDRTTGQGGSFDMVTNHLSDFTSMNEKLTTGGFNETLGIRACTGSISIAEGDTVRAKNVKITADGGDLTLNGAINVSRGEKNAGTVDLNAWGNLIIASTGNIDASSTSGKGGEVSLNAGHVGTWSGTGIQTGAGTGSLTMAQGSGIDVNGNAANEGGKAHFRAYRNSSSSNMNLNGTITGASDITAETAQAYLLATAGNVGDYGNYSIAPAPVSAANLNILPGTQGTATTLRTLSGIEIQSPGNLIFNSAWQNTTLSSADPGVLTLRAAGNLTINAGIIDNRTAYNLLYSGSNETMKNSWGINLIAGADTSSADIMTVMPARTQGETTGNLTIASQQRVYTENAPIRFASGGDTTINTGSTSNSSMIAQSMQYTLASYGGSINGRTVGNLNITGGVIQTAIGDINIHTGGDLMLNAVSAYRGTIRTTGEHAAERPVTEYETYGNGGNINLHVDGKISGALSTYWLRAKEERIDGLRYYRITPQYNDQQAQPHTTEGIATMAGGSVYVKAGGSYNAQTGAFGSGDLRIYSLDDLKGRFLVKEGIAEMNTGGNFGASNAKPLIEIYDAQVSVTAQGSLYIGGILNPALVKNSQFWDNQYTVDSSVTLNAYTGDIRAYGFNPSSDAYGFYAGSRWGSSYLPATVKVEAGRDISLSGTLMPSPEGQLRMKAGRDISGFIAMSDADISGSINPIYGMWRTSAAPDLTMLHGTVTDENGVHPLHYSDTEEVSIWADRDLVNMSITFPKKAVIHAGRDINSVNYLGMNISDDDVTRIYAGRDIVYSYGIAGTLNRKIEQRGPGYFIVQTGGSIDLGNSLGIITTGNSGVTALGPRGSSVIVAAGISRELGREETTGFFNSLRDAGDEYSTLLAAGDMSGAQQKVVEARTEIIAPFLPTINGSGNISMTSSQISTQAGGDVAIFAGGRIDVGRSAIKTNATELQNSVVKNTGIFTAIGGAINIFAQGDINVNEARIMSFMGGDITVWSDKGNVNAGRGSRTAISATPPRSYVEIVDGVQTVKTVFQIPAVGSGIRALAYDPDGPGPFSAPEPGILHVFAPTGTVDAGEAGMGGKSAFIGGVQVLNTQNMSFSQGAVGMPAQTQSVNLGSLGGTGLANKETLSTGMETLSNKVDSNSADTTKPIMEMLQRLEVKVISYELRLDEE